MGSMSAIFVKWHLITMMEGEQLLYLKFLVHVLSSAHKTSCWLKAVGTGSFDGLLDVMVPFNVPLHFWYLFDHKIYLFRTD